MTALSAPATRHIDTGRIVIARSQEEIDETVSRWREQGAQLLAHDLECAASATVRNGSGLHPHLGTIRLAQFAVGDVGDGVPEALVIDCWTLDPAPALELVADPEWPTLVHYAQMETRWLGYNYGLHIGSLIDTHLAAKLAHERRCMVTEFEPVVDDDIARMSDGRNLSFSLGIVCKREIGYEMDKSCQNSYWDAVSLSHAQLHYAGLDVLALLDLWPVLRPWLDEDDLRELANHAVERNARGNAVPETGPKGCESERALRMIRQCLSLAEADEMEAALPYMRLHHSARDQVARALAVRRRELAAGDVSPVQLARVAETRKPF